MPGSLHLDLRRWLSTHAIREVTRFLVVGLANTALTFAVYLALVPIIPYMLAFSVAFVCGLIFQTLMKIRVVFSSAVTLRRIARYVVYNCTYFAFNLMFLRMLVENRGASPPIAALISLCVMTPIHFVASRLVIAPDLELVPRLRPRRGASP